MRIWLFATFYNLVIRRALNRECKRLWIEAGSPGKFEPAERLDRKGREIIRQLMA